MEIKSKRIVAIDDITTFDSNVADSSNIDFSFKDADFYSDSLNSKNEIKSDIEDISTDEENPTIVKTCADLIRVFNILKVTELHFGDAYEGIIYYIKIEKDLFFNYSREYFFNESLFEINSNTNIIYPFYTNNSLCIDGNGHTIYGLCFKEEESHPDPESLHNFITVDYNIDERYDNIDNIGTRLIILKNLTVRNSNIFSVGESYSNMERTIDNKFNLVYSTDSNFILKNSIIYFRI